MGAETKIRAKHGQFAEPGPQFARDTVARHEDLRVGELRRMFAGSTLGVLRRLGGTPELLTRCGDFLSGGDRRVEGSNVRRRPSRSKARCFFVDAYRRIKVSSVASLTAR